MSYSAQTRDRFRLVVAAATGVTTVAAFASAGWVAGAAARESQTLQREQDAAAQAKYREELAAWRKATADSATTTPADQQGPRVVLRPRPERTDVTWRFVQGTGSAGTVGSGGQVTAVPAPPGGRQASTLPPPPPDPAPAPAPAPAPSSGS